MKTISRINISVDIFDILLSDKKEKEKTKRKRKNKHVKRTEILKTNKLNCNAIVIEINEYYFDERRNKTQL